MQLNVKLDKNFTTQINKLQEIYGEKFTYLNGLGEDQLSGTDFLDTFINTSTVADSSVDSSANVSHHDVVTLMKEMNKPTQKLLAYNKIYIQIQKDYGFKEANKWLEAQWNLALYMHDAPSASFLPYCYAYDLKRLAEEGLFFSPGRGTKPPKHLEVFVDFVKNFVSYAANRTSGAVGLPNLIPYMFYFWKQDCDKDYLGIKTSHREEMFAKQQIQRFIYAVNDEMVRDNIQSAFTNTSIFDHEYLMALFGGAVFPNGEFMVDYIEEIMNFQKWYMEVFSEERSQNMMTYPVNTISLLWDETNEEFVDVDFAKWAINHDVKWNDSNIFADTSVNSLSNCCRLRSSIEDIGYFNSIGGTSLRVGSVKVSTVNLARIALETKTEEEYIDKLKDRLHTNLIALDAQRTIIKKNIQKGILPNYCDGMIDISTQYSTIGVLGIYETMKTFGYIYQDKLGNTFYADEAFEFGKKIFDTIHAVKADFMSDKDYQINVEAVPGESAAVKFLKADIELFGKDKACMDLPLYGNQFIPLGIKTTMQERIKIASAFDSYCNGGSILHFNIEAPFANFDQEWEMVHYIVKHGCTYFAFNRKISVCEHNHAFNGTTCPICGGKVCDTYTRVVGFYVKTSTWEKERKAEFAMREWAGSEDLQFGTDTV